METPIVYLKDKLIGQFFVLEVTMRDGNCWKYPVVPIAYLEF